MLGQRTLNGNKKYLVGMVNDKCVSLTEKLTGNDVGYFIYMDVGASWVFRIFCKFYTEETLKLVSMNLQILNTPEPEIEYALATGPVKKGKKKS